jgi:hypothetical protein
LGAKLPSGLFHHSRFGVRFTNANPPFLILIETLQVLQLLQRIFQSLFLQTVKDPQGMGAHDFARFLCQGFGGRIDTLNLAVYRSPSQDREMKESEVPLNNVSS